MSKNIFFNENFNDIYNNFEKYFPTITFKDIFDFKDIYKKLLFNEKNNINILDINFKISENKKNLKNKIYQDKEDNIIDYYRIKMSYNEKSNGKKIGIKYLFEKNKLKCPFIEFDNDDDDKKKTDEEIENIININDNILSNNIINSEIINKNLNDNEYIESKILYENLNEKDIFIKSSINNEIDNIKNIYNNFVYLSENNTNELFEDINEKQNNIESNMIIDNENKKEKNIDKIEKQNNIESNMIINNENIKKEKNFDKIEKQNNIESNMIINNENINKILIEEQNNKSNIIIDDQNINKILIEKQNNNIKESNIIIDDNNIKNENDEKKNKNKDIDNIKILKDDFLLINNTKIMDNEFIMIKPKDNKKIDDLKNKNNIENNFFEKKIDIKKSLYNINNMDLGSEKKMNENINQTFTENLDSINEENNNIILHNELISDNDNKYIWPKLSIDMICTSFKVIGDLQTGAKLKVVDNTHLAEDNSYLGPISRYTNEQGKEKIISFLDHLYYQTEKNVNNILSDIRNGINVDKNVSVLQSIVSKLHIFLHRYENMRNVYKSHSGPHARLGVIRDKFYTFDHTLFRDLAIPKNFNN